MKKKVMMERIVKISDSNDDWSIKFWERCGKSSKMSVSWEMLQQHYKLRGKKNGFKPRLRRDVENIKQI